MASKSKQRRRKQWRGEKGSRMRGVSICARIILKASAYGERHQ